MAIGRSENPGTSRLAFPITAIPRHVPCSVPVTALFVPCSDLEEKSSSAMESGFCKPPRTKTQKSPLLFSLLAGNLGRYFSLLTGINWGCQNCQNPVIARIEDGMIHAIRAGRQGLNAEC